MHTALVDESTYEYKEKNLARLQKLKNIVKDIDDGEIKQAVNIYLKNFSNAYTFVVLGEVNAGKSSFINALLRENICKVSPVPCTNIIHELRFGEQPAVVDVSANNKRQFVNNELLRNIAVVDTPGTGSVERAHQTITEKYMGASDLIIAVIPAVNPYNDEIWESIQAAKSKHGGRNVVFVLQQKDQLDEAVLKRNLAAVIERAKKIGINEPEVFCVSANEEFSGLENSGYGDFRNYVRTNITSTDILALKQCNNLRDIDNIVALVEDSIEKRQRQYNEDIAIVTKINTTIDSFRNKHNETIGDLMDKLLAEIDRLIEDYRVQIIKKLDPNTIMSEFTSKADFERWLNARNENYKEIMNKAINRLTKEAVNNYLMDLEFVLDKANSYLLDRKLYLEFENRAYGSLSVVKNNIVTGLKTTINETKEYNVSLYQASGELYLRIWEARQKYNNKMKAATLLASAGTAVGLQALSSLLTGAAAASATTAAGAAAASAAAIPPLFIVGTAVVAGFVIYKMSKDFFKPGMMGEVEKSINIFNEQVEQSKIVMKKKISEHINELFENELLTLDRCFLDFRTVTHIEESILPQLLSEINELKANENESATMEG